jgi:thiamine thiazole synthase
MAPVLTQNSESKFDNNIGKLKLSNGSTREFDVAENYEGEYRFAPIQEAQVSRAMIKR